MTDTTYDNSTELDPRIAARLKRDAKGLVAAVIQQYDTREVLMVGYMNDEALRRTLTTGPVRNTGARVIPPAMCNTSRACPWIATATHCSSKSTKSVPPATPASAAASSKAAPCPWSKAIARPSSRTGFPDWGKPSDRVL